MIDFEFFEHGGVMRTAEVTKLATGFVVTLADDPGVRAEAAGRAEAIALLKQRVAGGAPVQPAVAPRPARPARPVTRLGRPGHVLVVDDNPTTIQVAMMVCQLCGHASVGARDGAEAWQALQAGPVDLVLTDLHMPGVGGLALVQALRTHRPELPIIAVTAAGPNGLRALEQLGVDEVVRKPFAVQQLAEAIGKLIIPA